MWVHGESYNLLHGGVSFSLVGVVGVCLAWLRQQSKQLAMEAALTAVCAFTKITLMAFTAASNSLLAVKHCSTALLGAYTSFVQRMHYSGLPVLWVNNLCLCDQQLSLLQ
jgi:hypothetical protein